jgi:hypothetical protein
LERSKIRDDVVTQLRELEKEKEKEKQRREKLEIGNCKTKNKKNDYMRYFRIIITK